jgi:hypothetical protein
MSCKGCAERREKIIETARSVIDWMKNPTFGGHPPSEAFDPSGRPKPPLRPPRDLTKTNKLKRN